MGGDPLITPMCARLAAEYPLKQTKSTADQLERGKGIAYVVFRHTHGRSESYLIRAKDYCYKGLAPFGAEMVETALRLDRERSDEHLLVIYFDDSKEFWVFDPAYVEAKGSKSQGRSKRSAARPWLEVSLTAGCRLREYLSGESEPTRLTTRSNEFSQLSDFY